MHEKPISTSGPVLSLDPSDCNCNALQQAARQVNQLYGRHMAKEGLRTGQYSILAKLNRLGPMPITELASILAMDRTTMSRAVQPLKRDKLIAIGAGEDGRTRLVRLTAAGEARVASASARWREAQKEFEQALGPGVAAQLRETLSRVVALG